MNVAHHGGLPRGVPRFDRPITYRKCSPRSCSAYGASPCIGVAYLGSSPCMPCIIRVKIHHMQLSGLYAYDSKWSDSTPQITRPQIKLKDNIINDKT
ncbi:hypothetical protein VNO77_33647 [Canavalia gladiata]|uniref:Uncharacterized protein n=1 Tax=Canavalia gladiata TaxID=3824 RepID=A0AAN9KC80_CANGL